MVAGNLIAPPPLSQKSQEREDEESSSSSKRQKGRSSSATSTTLKLALDDLGDDELIQIFRRLPTAKFACAIKLISKRWYSLISDPYFVTQFVTHRINKYPNPIRVFISSYPQPQLFRVIGDDSVFESRGYALEFLPEEREFVFVVASCNDLLYCRVMKRGNFPQKFYICNPLTMQWFLLPSPPPSDPHATINFGLVCEPNYLKWKQGQRYECRFRAVNILSGFKKHSVATYCSETGQWKESLIFGRDYFPSSNVVAHDGKLHWFKFYAPGVVVYDPFNNSVQSIVIDGFDVAPSLHCERFSCIGVCQGMVRFMQLVRYMDTDDNDNLSVWELEDYASGRLSLKHRIFCKREFRKLSKWVQPLACHPNNKDVVYLRNTKFIISCKIKSGRLKVIGNTLNEALTQRIKDVLTTVIPWWPTPLPQNAHVLEHNNIN